MGISVNDERNNLLYDFWERHATIQQTANQTGIPRSSVGYFFQKFDRYKAKGKTLERGVVGMDEIERKSEEIKTRLAYKKVIEQLKAEERYPEAREVAQLYVAEKQGGLHIDQIHNDNLRQKENARNVELKYQALDEIEIIGEVIAEWEDVGFFHKGNEFGSSLTYFSKDVIEFIRGHPKEVSDQEFTYSLSAEGDKLVKQRKNPRRNDLDTVRVTKVRPEKKKLAITNNNVTKKNLPTIEFTSIRHEPDKVDPKVKKTGN